MKIVIAGSRKLPAGVGVQVISPLHRLAAKGPVEVLLRRGIRTAPGGFEADVYRIVRELAAVGDDIVVTWRLPDTNGGRASVYARDIEMVADADLVLVYLADEDAEEAYSGTYHVFEQALQQERPVYGWVVRPMRTMTYGTDTAPHWILGPLGDYDPAHLYTSLFA